MQTSNDDNNSIFNDPEWYFLAEFTLSELMVDVDQRGEPTVGLIHQTIRGLGITPECLDNIERALTRFAKKAMADLDRGRSELPVYIRSFCQKKTVEDVNLPKSSSQFTEQQRVDPIKIIHHSEGDLNGGWGYFLVERRGGLAPNSTGSTYSLVDLYLYKEGE